MYGAEPLLPPVRSASPALARATSEAVPSTTPWAPNSSSPPAVSRVTSMLPPTLSPKIQTIQHRRGSALGASSPPTPTNRASALPHSIAQRCQAILSHTISKLGLVDSLFQMYNQYLLEQRDGVDAAVTLARAQNKGEGMFFAPDSTEGDEILNLILMQRQLQTEYSDLMANREAFRANNDRSAFAQNEIQLKAITSSLREVSARVYDKLKLLDLHIAATVGPKYHTQANDIAASLQQVAGQLDHGRFDSLFMQLPPQFLPASVMRSVQNNKGATASPNAANPSGTTTPSPRQSARGEGKTTAVEEAVGQLQDEIARERADFERQIAHKNESVHALTEELRRVRSEVESAVKYERDTEEAKLETRARMRRKDLSELTAQLQQAQRNLDLDGSVHQLSMEFLGRRRNTMEKEAQFWENKYNEEHGALVHQLNELQAQRDRDYTLLEQLRERWHRMQSENQAAEAERARNEEKVAAQSKMNRIYYIAQTRIRFAWRCFRRRKMNIAAKLAAKKKKKKGGKKDSTKGRPGTSGRPKSAR